MAHKQSLRVTVSLFPLVLLLGFIVLKIVDDAAYRSLIRENGPVENIQAVFFLLTAVAAGWAAIGFLKNRIYLFGFFYIVAAVGFIFVGMEEIAWGQHFLNLPLPEYFSRHNVQKELSLHNLQHARAYVNEAYIFIGLFCGLGWLIIPDKVKGINRDVAGYVIPNRGLMLYFLPVFFFFVYVTYLSGPLVLLTGADDFYVWFRSAVFKDGYLIDMIDQEPMELIMALGFFLFVTRSALLRHRGQQLEKKGGGKLMLMVAVIFGLIAIPWHLAHGYVLKEIYLYDRLEFANQLSGANQVDEAIKIYLDILAQYPSHADTMSNMGVALMRRSRIKEAETYFKKAVQYSPDDAVLNYNLANCLVQQRRFSEALSLYNKILAADPGLWNPPAMSACESPYSAARSRSASGR